MDLVTRGALIMDCGAREPLMRAPILSTWGQLSISKVYVPGRLCWPDLSRVLRKASDWACNEGWVKFGLLKFALLAYVVTRELIEQTTVHC